MTQPTYRERLENRFAELQFDLLLLVGTQPEHNIDLATLDDAALVQTGKQLNRRLAELRESETERQRARDYDAIDAAGYDAAVAIAQALNTEHEAPVGTSWQRRWQLVRHRTNEKTSIYAEQADAISYARRTWKECKFALAH